MVADAPLPAVPSVPIPALCTTATLHTTAGLQGQHRAGPLGPLSTTHGQPRDLVLQTQTHSTQLESQDTRTRTCRTRTIQEHPEVPFPLRSISCSSAPQTQGWTQLTHLLPSPLQASWPVPDGAH